MAYLKSGVLKNKGQLHKGGVVQKRLSTTDID